MDYYPYGDIRLDEKAGSFSEQRKYAGQEYDADTGLSYMNARYYKSDIGRFISEDPEFWRMSKLDIQLTDPQSWNSYAYARNNPLVNIDVDGNFSVSSFLNSAQIRIGNWANNAYERSSVARLALDHPYAPAVIGATPLAAYSAVVAAPTVISGASELLTSTTAAPIIRSGGIGAVGGLAGQAISDGLTSIADGSLRVSSGREYANSAIEGAFAGPIKGFKGATYVAGAVVGVTNYALNKLETGDASISESVSSGITTIIGGKLVDLASGIPGRLPNIGTSNYYLGRHAQQLGLGEITENAFSSVVNLFNPTKKEK